MSERSTFCPILIDIGNIGFAITAIVLIALVYNDTKVNPLEVYDDILNKSAQPFFEASPPFQLFNEIENYCQCGERTLNNICSEEQIISGCYDISKKREKALLRNLDVNNCEVINKVITYQNGKFSKVFDIGFDTVHGMAKGILVCIGCILGLFILSTICKYCAVNCEESGAGLFMGCTGCYICAGAIGGLAEFVCVIILIVNFYSGTTTGEFLDWYENCNIIEPYKTGLKGAYKTLDEVYSYMIALIILTFAQMIFNGIVTSSLVSVVTQQRIQ